MNKNTMPSLTNEVVMIESSAPEKKIIRVGAYCRVSTNLETQRKSMDTQMAAYERIIQAHPGWELVDIYADQGISGTSVRSRTEFLRMMEDARTGKLDYLLVKSISRFSRNTVDLLSFVRELSDLGVRVFFEKERIDTGELASEFLLSVFAAAAQEEIISLSNNLKVGIRMRYARGEQHWSNVYGYRKGWVIEQSEADVIRYIFDRYLNGSTLVEIRRELNKRDWSEQNKAQWSATTLSNVLHNEKYAGDLRMQKTFIDDPLTSHEAKNRSSIIPQYYVRDHHQAIVSHEVFDTVQEILTMRDPSRGVKQYPFYGLLKCPYCGMNMVRFKRNKSAYWTCGGQGDAIIREERTKCIPYAVREDALVQALASAGYPSDYAPLKARIVSMTFPRWDWTHLKVIPSGAEKRPFLLPVNYEYPEYTPYPVFTEKTRECNVRGQIKVIKIIYINGKKIRSGCGNYTRNFIKLLQQQVNHLVIRPPEDYELNIPRIEPEGN